MKHNLVHIVFGLLGLLLPFSCSAPYEVSEDVFRVKTEWGKSKADVMKGLSGMDFSEDGNYVILNEPTGYDLLIYEFAAEGLVRIIGYVKGAPEEADAVGSKRLDGYTCLGHTNKQTSVYINEKQNSLAIVSYLKTHDIEYVALAWSALSEDK